MADSPVHFVFDLDDTLYAEEDYVRSGLSYVGEVVAAQFGVADAADRLLALRSRGDADPIGLMWRDRGLPVDAQPNAIAAMRSHRPNIGLRTDAAVFLDRLRADGKGYAIVTDGRSITQRQKIAALGCLDALFVSVSEEVGLAKTDPARFAAVQESLGPGLYVYLGDNPAKDFVAPNSLGWLTVMLAHRGAGVHCQNLPADIGYHPQAIVESFDELWPLAAKAACNRSQI